MDAMPQTVIGGPEVNAHMRSSTHKCQHLYVTQEKSDMIAEKKEKEENSYTKNSSKLISHMSGCEGEKDVKLMEGNKPGLGAIYFEKSTVEKRKPSSCLCVQNHDYKLGYQFDTQLSTRMLSALY